MIDLETLGTKPDSVIISLGIIKFDPYSRTLLLTLLIMIICYAKNKDALQNNLRSIHCWS